MKTVIIILLATLLTFTSVFGAEGKSCKSGMIFSNNSHLDNTDIDIDDGTIIITHRGRDYTVVEITEDYELFINGRQVELNQDQKELVKEYHNLVMEISEAAAEIGLEGAKIGIDGAKIGVKAVRGVLRMFLTDYDSDDLEREMEKAAEKLEARAEELEEQAEEIEEMAEELEEVAEELEEQIPELDELRWF